MGRRRGGCEGARESHDLPLSNGLYRAENDKLPIEKLHQVLFSLSSKEQQSKSALAAIQGEMDTLPQTSNEKPVLWRPLCISYTFPSTVNNHFANELLGGCRRKSPDQPQSSPGPAATGKGWFRVSRPGAIDKPTFYLWQDQHLSILGWRWKQNLPSRFPEVFILDYMDIISEVSDITKMLLLRAFLLQ